MKEDLEERLAFLGWSETDLRVLAALDPSLEHHADRFVAAFYRHLLYGELLVLPNCGHNTYEERPAEYLQAILDFHARLRNPNSRRKARVSCAA